jgi:hypothetical protein
MALSGGHALLVTALVHESCTSAVSENNSMISHLIRWQPEGETVNRISYDGAHT